MLTQDQIASFAASCNFGQLEYNLLDTLCDYVDKGRDEAATLALADALADIANLRGAERDLLMALIYYANNGRTRAQLIGLLQPLADVADD